MDILDILVQEVEINELIKRIETLENMNAALCLDKLNYDLMTGYILAFYARQKLQEIFKEIEFEIQQLVCDDFETKAIAIEGIITKIKKKYIKSEGDSMLSDLEPILKGE